MVTKHDQSNIVGWLKCLWTSNIWSNTVKYLIIIFIGTVTKHVLYRFYGAFHKTLTSGFWSLFEIPEVRCTNLAILLNLCSCQSNAELRWGVKKFIASEVQAIERIAEVHVKMSWNFVICCGHVNKELLVFTNLYIAKMGSALTYLLILL